MDKIFNDRYEIIEKIGTGGMANVYKATDNVLERTVAIKVLHQQYASDDSFISRFKSEAKSAANLNHPNIVNIYDWGQQESHYYIVMEYIKGKNLKEILAEKGKLSWKDAAKIGSKVAAALTFAHRNDVVHRDIKPHNIIITSNNDVKVTDFGIAKAGASSMTQTGTILGTAHYISPEQAQGKQADSRSDIYSLGIVLYETVSGKMPFDGENPIGIAMKHVSEAAPSLSETGIPQNFQNVITKALAKDPDERYQTAEELREDLNSVLAGASVSAPLPSEDKTVILAPVSAPQSAHPVQKRRKRHKWPYVVSFILVMFLVLGFFAYSLVNKPKIPVPDLSGMKSIDAAQLLKQRKLKMKVVASKFSDGVTPGEIISQNPASGSQVGEGTMVEVVVSKGKEMVNIPAITGQSRSEAEQTLSDSGLSLGSITYRESSGPTGVVLDQNPNSGTNIAKGSTVDLVISKEIPKATVPNIVGRSRKNSGVILKQAGLYASYVEKYDSNIKAGLVIDQSPNAGEQVKRGTTVVVYISKGAEAPVVQKVEVPDVSGLEKSAAAAQISGAGLTVEYSGTGVTVDHQSPSGGTMVDEGSTVTLYLVP